MNCRHLGFYLCLTACFSSLVAGSVKAESSSLSQLESSNGELEAPPSRIRAIAQAITVKVVVGNLWGSGIIIRRQNNVYTVLTNAHVARLGQSYRIQTPDGRVYPARLEKTNELDGEDLAALTFASRGRYQVASVATAKRYYPDSLVYAAGFPAKSRQSGGTGFIVTDGKVAALLPRSLRGGYQLGYTNDIYKGMSGGPLLDRMGKVIAVNGKHKFPLWGNTYIYEDGSSPDAVSRKQMDYLSWGIPMSSVSQKLPALVPPKTAEASQNAESTLRLDGKPNASEPESNLFGWDGGNNKYFPPLPPIAESDKPNYWSRTRIPSQNRPRKAW